MKYIAGMGSWKSAFESSADIHEAPAPSLSRRQWLLCAAVPFAGIGGCGGGSEDPGSGAVSSAAAGRSSALAVGPAGSPYSSLGKGGMFIHTPYTAAGDFELLMADTKGVVHTLKRHNDTAGKPWTLSSQQGLGSNGSITGVAQIYSSNHRHVEAVVVDGGAVKAYFRDDRLGWTQLKDVGLKDAQGIPGLVQASLDGLLQFELIVGLRSGGMAHYFRDERNGPAWKLRATFGSGQVGGVSLLQSNFIGANGRAKLAAAVWVDTRLEFWEFAEGAWSRTAIVAASGISGAPALLQSNFGQKGNFELVAPLAAGGLGTWWRNNDLATLPWNAFSRVGTGAYRAAAMLQGYDGAKGNFELVALRDDLVDVF